MIQFTFGENCEGAEGLRDLPSTSLKRLKRLAARFVVFDSLFFVAAAVRAAVKALQRRTFRGPRSMVNI